MAIELGNAIMSVLASLLMSLAETISKLTAWFSELSDGTKRFIVIIGMVVAAVGPVLIIVSKIMSAVGTIMMVVPKLAGVINTVKNAFVALNSFLCRIRVMCLYQRWKRTAVERQKRELHRGMLSVRVW